MLLFFCNRSLFYHSKRRVRESYKQYFLPTVEIKDNNVMIDGRNFFHKPIKNDLRRYDNIRKIAIGQGDDYTTGCLTDCLYFKNYYKLIAIDLSKQQKLDVDAKAIKQINFSGNLGRGCITPMFHIIKGVKETVLDFSQGTVKVLWIYFTLIYYQYKITQYNTLSVKLSNSKLNKLKSGIKNGTEATDAAIHKKMFGSSETTLIISNEEMNDAMKIVKSLEESGLFMKVFMEQFKMKQKNKKVDFSVCY